MRTITQRFIERAKPGRHTDVFGLSLFVAKGGSRQWHWRGTLDGQQVVVSMGSARETSPDEAREIALQYRKLARAGTDPTNRRNTVPSLRDAVAAVVESKRSTWKNADRTADRWTKTTNKHLARIINRDISKITTADVEAAILPTWGRASATDALQYLGCAYDWAVAHGHASANVAKQAKAILPKPKRAVQHQRSLPYADVADMLERIESSRAMTATKLTIKFITLTGLRSREAADLEWSEVDMDARTVTIGADRMKAGAEHVVPLSGAALAVLDAAKALHGDAHVFVGAKGRTLSDGTLAKLMRDQKIESTIHGLRATFSTWAADCTDYAKEVREACLAHSTGNSTERSYQRGTFFAKRAQMMESWAAFATAGNVVSIRKSA